MSSAAAADVVKEFLTKIDVTCKSSEHKLLTCNIDNILVTNCRNATIQCENMSTATKVLCDPAQTVQDIANLVADKIKTAADKAALSKNLKSTPIPEDGDRPLIIQRVTQHLTQECINEITARQTMDYPLIALSNCSNVLITALNRLDTNSTCALGVATDLLHGVGKANSPSTNGNQDPPSGLPVSYIALIVIGVAVLGIIAYALYRSRQTLPSPSPAATTGGLGAISATKAGKSA